MKVETLATDGENATQVPVLPFNSAGLERLFHLKQTFDDLEYTLNDFKKLGGPDTERSAEKLKRQLREFEPAITMIGQVKAGKTSLVNAMAGQPGLLPADVNPWTSVVTSLHFNTHRREDAPQASFRMFDHDEWDRLVKGGGRIGELSQRAGADDEIAKVQAQIEKVREKTRERLGRRFELLMGQVHDYATLSDDLVQRYVCMGDDFDLADREQQKGWFADITKTADLYLTTSALPMPLCIRDTPGMNDTFMMREQITINALRESRICVVVLSAHQALSTMDLALIRLIANVKSRELVIFVNRIDELNDPARDISDIHASISTTLDTHGCPSNVQIVFGSAYWANLALNGQMDTIVPDSAKAFHNYAPGKLGTNSASIAPETLWTASGLPDLYDALAQRIVEGPASEILNTVRQKAKNQLGGLQTSSHIASVRKTQSKVHLVDQDTALQEFDAIAEVALRDISESIEALIANFSARADRSHQRFLERALEALMQHLETGDDTRVWQYSADGLRVLLRTSYNVMQRTFAKQLGAGFGKTAQDLTDLYQRLFGVSVDAVSVEPPQVPNAPAPVALGQTIALDLQTSWWRGWWNKRRGHRNLADNYLNLIEVETTPIVETLKDQHCAEMRQSAMTAFNDFLADQRAILMEVSSKTQASTDDLGTLFGLSDEVDRQTMYGTIMNELNIGAEKEERQ